jgi:hypothetical protein
MKNGQMNNSVLQMKKKKKTIPEQLLGLRRQKFLNSMQVRKAVHYMKST